MATFHLARTRKTSLKSLGLAFRQTIHCTGAFPILVLLASKGLERKVTLHSSTTIQRYKRWTISPGPKGSTLSSLVGNFAGSVTTNWAALLPAAASLSTNGTHKTLIWPRGCP